MSLQTAIAGSLSLAGDRPFVSAECMDRHECFDVKDCRQAVHIPKMRSHEQRDQHDVPR